MEVLSWPSLPIDTSNFLNLAKKHILVMFSVVPIGFTHIIVIEMR